MKALIVASFFIILGAYTFYIGINSLRQKKFTFMIGWIDPLLYGSKKPIKFQINGSLAFLIGLITLIGGLAVIYFGVNLLKYV